MFSQIIVLCIVILLAGGLVVLTAWKYHHISKARSYIIAMPVMCGFLLILGVTAREFEAGCFGDPTRTCNYNDMVPMISVAVFIFVSMALIKAYLLFADK